MEQIEKFKELLQEEGIAKTTNGMPSNIADQEAKNLQKQIEEMVNGAKNQANIEPVEIKITGSADYTPPKDSDVNKTKKAAKETKTAIDWISQSLKVLQQNIDLTKAKFENLFTVKAKKNNVKEQIKQ